MASDEQRRCAAEHVGRKIAMRPLVKAIEGGALDELLRDHWEGPGHAGRRCWASVRELAEALEVDVVYDGTVTRVLNSRARELGL